MEKRTLPESLLLHDIFLDTEKFFWPNDAFTSGMSEVKISRTARRLYIDILPDSQDMWDPSEYHNWWLPR